MAAQPERDPWQVIEALREFEADYDGPQDADSIGRAFVEQLPPHFYPLAIRQATPYLLRNLDGLRRREIITTGNVRAPRHIDPTRPRAEGRSWQDRMKAREDWRPNFPVHIGGRRVTLAEMTAADHRERAREFRSSATIFAAKADEHDAYANMMDEQGAVRSDDLPVSAANQIFRAVRTDG